MTEFHEIGCKKCDTGNWAILTDGEGNFRARCRNCGYTVDVPPGQLKTGPDAIDMRLIV